MKSTRSALFAAILCGMFVATGVQAATDSVTATVTVLYSAVSLNQSSFAYGSISSNAASSTLPLWSGAGITATNDGGAADFDIYGANSTGGGTGWTLAGNTTGNNYIHRFCNDTDSACTSAPTNYTALTTSPQTLKTNVAGSGTVAFQLQITTPTTPTDFTEQSTAVTIQASAI